LPRTTDGKDRIELGVTQNLKRGFGHVTHSDLATAGTNPFPKDGHESDRVGSKVYAVFKANNDMLHAWGLDLFQEIVLCLAARSK
jgi:hypothetical protein